MRDEEINAAVFACIRHAQGSPVAASKFLANLRNDSQWTVKDLDRVAQYAMPIVRQFMEHKLQTSQSD